MKRILFLLAGLALCQINAFSQVLTPIHADDILIRKAVAEDNNLLFRYMIYEDNLKILEQHEKTDTLIGGKRIIPVVFHIIHVYGAENISDAQVADALDRLNIDYNLQNADTADTYSLFKSRAANCQIEFRLAAIDPDGNCTSGIVRHYDPQTNFAYFSTMSQYAWEPSHYMNIFAVNFIYPEGMSLPEGAFIGGMSPFPPSNALTQALTGGDTLMDGVLIRQDCIGSIGTAQNMGGMPLNMMNRTFTHETGHYFNLYHPFQNLILGILPASSGCPDWLAPNGDEVDDTPPVAAATQNTSTVCFTPGSRNTCDQDDPDEPDMIENYMDYQFGYCTNIFSLGQLDRINTTMMNDRRSLWSYENLLATGVLDAPVLCAPKADFYASSNAVCAGESVTFNDVSFNGAVASWEWSFPGGNPATSVDQHPVVQYNNPGTYGATLKVFNASGADSLTRTDLIVVSDPAVVVMAPYEESFETINFSAEMMVSNEQGNEWELHSALGYTGTKCAWLNNFENNKAGSTDQLITEAFSLSNLPTTTHARISFRYAYAGKYIPASIASAADTAYDKMIVSLSTDCGQTWTTKFTLSGETMATSAPVETSFEPASASEWALKEIPVPAGTLPQYDHVRLKFDFYSNGGNNIYVDDILIYSVFASIEDYLNPQSFVVYPNPISEQSQVMFVLDKTADVELTVYDVNGREVSVLEKGLLHPGEYSFRLDDSNFAAGGTYLISLSVNGEKISRSVVY